MLLTYGIAMVLLAGAATALGAIIKHEPNFFRQARVPASDARNQQALECLTKFSQMSVDKDARQAKWGCDVTEAQMNSFFEEFFADRGESEGLRKLGVSSPSVVLEDDQLRLAFRYDSGWFTTVLSYQLKVWLVPKEPNTIAVEFMSARAGALPISSQLILQQLSDVARKQEYKVNLYRHEGNTVAVIQLQPNENHPWWLLTALQVSSNKLSIRGKTLDHALPAPQPKAPPAVIAK